MSGDSAPYPLDKMSFSDRRLPKSQLGPMCIHLRAEHGMGFRSIAKRLGWTETEVRKCLTAAGVS